MASHRHPFRVLYIEDDHDNIEALTFARGEDWQITAVDKPDRLFEGDLQPNAFDVLFLDLVIHRDQNRNLDFAQPIPSAGLDVLRWLADNAPTTPVVVVSALLPDAGLSYELEQIYPKLLWFPKPIDFSDEAFARLVERFATENAKAAKA